MVIIGSLVQDGLRGMELTKIGVQEKQHRRERGEPQRTQRRLRFYESN
jgi:hypothetical protein